VQGEVCLDRADLVIDGMTGEGKSVRKENRGKEERVFPV
jgi:hypothetical protein